MLRDSNGAIQVLEHTEVLRALAQGELSHTLLVGPRSVGKRTILEWLIERHRVTDVVRIYSTKDLDMAEVQNLALESSSSQRVILMRLDYLKARDAERLLKVIEDAHPGVTFLCTRTTPDGRSALLSRFTTYSVGFLTDKAVGLILSRIGYAPDKAADLAEKSLGAVNPTIGLGKNLGAVSLVNKALKSIEENDADALDKLYTKWDDDHTRTIRTWAQERITGRWRVFQESDFPDLGKGTALKIWTRVSLAERPRYVVRASLASIVMENRK